MNNPTFVALATALSSSVATALAGINFLPLEDYQKAAATFTLSIVATFLATLLKPPTGLQVAKNQEPKR